MRFIGRSGDVTSAVAYDHGDTRFLSRWVLTVNGKNPNYIDSPVSISRRREVGGGFHEDLKIVNHKSKQIDLDVRVEADADFADLFQVKDAEFQRAGTFYRRIEGNRLILGYQRDRFVRETQISSKAPAEIDEKGFQFKVHLEPQPAELDEQRTPTPFFMAGF
jgi:glycogen debranching enzyme